MKAYYFTFIIAYLFAFLGEKLIKKHSNGLGKFSLLISLAIVCLVAGVRNIEIGTDVRIYLYPMFKGFAFNGTTIIYQILNSKTEIGFVILLYIVSVLKNVNVLMFVVEICIALPIYIYAYKQKDKYSISFIILIFLLTMYVRSFNIIRQSIAMSIIILSTYYFENKKYKRTLMLSILAMMFHKSAIICVLIYMFIIISKSKRDKRNSLIILTYAGIIMVMFMLGPILNAFFAKYATYMEPSGDSESTLTISRIMKKFFWIALSFVYLSFARKNNKDNHEKALLCVNLFVSEFILSLISLKIPNSARLGYYLINLGYIVLCINTPRICKQKRFIQLFLIVILFAFWYKMTAIVDSGDGTYPYISDILTFLN